MILVPELALDGKTVAVTGAASPRGMGYAMATAVLEAGARVALIDINREYLEESASDLRGKHGSGAVLSLVTDISRPDEVQRTVDQVVGEFGQLDVLVNNAGVNAELLGYCDGTTPFWEVPAEAWGAVAAVNYLGQVYMASAAARHMIGRGRGMIIGVTTSLDTMWRARNTPYGATKAAHEAFVTSASFALAGRGVCANILVPGGTTRTDLLGERIHLDDPSMLQPGVMREPVVWLCSDEAAEVTGKRFIASLWDSSLPVEERLLQAGAPSAWQALGRRSAWSLS